MKKLFRSLLLSTLILLSFCMSVFAQDSQLPAKYDLRNLNGKDYVTSVKFQNPWGACWAFGATATAETSAILKGAPNTFNLSERSLAWFNSRLQKNLGAPDSTYEGFYTLSSQGAPSQVGFQTWAAFNNGGNAWMALNQLASWNGTNTEAQSPFINDEHLYDNKGEPSMQGTWSVPYNMLYNRNAHLQNGEVIFSSSTKAPDGHNSIFNTQPEVFVPKMKEDIYNHGAVMISFGFNQDRFIGNTFFNKSTSAYYNYDATIQQPDHGVCVVGWDDTYPASNFAMTPPGDGAFIVKNSWGADWGDQGFFYLSYYDQSINYYCWMDVETADTTDGYSYDNIYQNDLLGAKNIDAGAIFPEKLDQAGYDPGSLEFANIFTTKNNETLQAISAFDMNTYSLPTTQQTDYEVYILKDGYTSPTDGQLVAQGSLTTTEYGFHTIKLDSPVKIPAGTAFSVVENQQVTVETSNGTASGPMLSLEYGYEQPLEEELQSPDGSPNGSSITEYKATAQKGETFIYGLNGKSWEDVTSPEIENNDLIHFTNDTPLNGTTIQNKSTIGNALIKAYTTNDEVVPPSPEQPEVDNIILSPDLTYLSTKPGEKNSVTISASFEPANAHLDVDNLVWAATQNVVDMQVDPSNLSVTITAKEEGYAAIECFNGAQIGLALVRVSDQPVIADSITVTNNSPDSFDITVGNLRSNPALSTQTNVDSLSIYSWSATNQSDINAKRVSKQAGSNDYVLEDIPVNDNPINNYFISGDSIRIHVYANSGTNQYYIGDTLANWVGGEMIDPNQIYNLSTPLLTYITYGQNVGFVKPSVFNPATSGVIGLNNSKHLEGVRVSSNVMGMSVATQVYASGLGWLDGSDGQYTGTMGQNRPIEAINMNMTGPYTYQVGGTLTYRAYIDGQGWSEWAPNNTTVGIPNSGHPILGIEVSVTQDR